VAQGRAAWDKLSAEQAEVVALLGPVLNQAADRGDTDAQGLVIAMGL
jgi:hypothetical protein